AAGAFEPPGPGQSMHMVIDLTGRAETLVPGELGHGRRALIGRLQQLDPDGMAERCQATGRLGEIDLLQTLPRHPHLPAHGCLSPGGSGVPGVGHPIAEVVDESVQGQNVSLSPGRAGAESAAADDRSVAEDAPGAFDVAAAFASVGSVDVAAASSSATLRSSA